jgi:predicted O-methyltransferase YrrM
LKRSGAVRRWTSRDLSGLDDGAGQLAQARRRLSVSRKLLAQTRGQLIEVVERSDRLAALLTETRMQLDETRTHLNEVCDRWDALEILLDATRAAAVEQDVRMTVLNARVDDLQVVTDDRGTGHELLFGADGRYRSRVVRAAELLHLAEELSHLAAADDVDRALAQSYRLLFELEIRGLGRVAGSVANILGRFAAVALLHPANGDALEIGTLFGLGAVGIARQLSRQGLDGYLTIVDPFLGYQLQPDQDATMDVSGSPATQRVVEQNLALGGVPPDRFRLIEGSSASQEVRAAAADRRYGLIVIDGDHSEEAAYGDLLWAESLAAPGGLVILDDYRDDSWPGVELALDRYLAGADATMTLIGSAATSAFLRAPAGR